MMTRVALTLVRLQEDRDDDEMNMTSVIGVCDDDTGRSHTPSSATNARLRNLRIHKLAYHQINVTHL